MNGGDDKMDVRDAQVAELDRLTAIWHEGWNDAHASIVPAGLVAVRTFESFRMRLRDALPNTRVVGAVGNPLGFCIIKGDELYQLYVSRASRGSGVAGALVADAEARLVQRGVKTAWLACAIGNERAAKFYEKCGWRRARVEAYDAETATGPYRLEVWRYEKLLPQE